MDSSRSWSSRLGGLLLGPAIFGLLIGVGLVYAHLTPDAPLKTTRLAASCTTPYQDGYTLRFAARIPVVDEGLGDLSVSRWQTRFSFTRQGGGDPLHLAQRSGSSYEFDTDDSPVFAHLLGYDQPFGAWQRHDDSSEYARTNLTLDRPALAAHFAVPGGASCTANLNEPKEIS